MKSRLSLAVITLGLIVAPGVTRTDFPAPNIPPLAIASTRTDFPAPNIPPLALAGGRTDFPAPNIPPLATPAS